MTREPSGSTEGFDPFAPPAAENRFGRSVVPVPSIPPAGASWSVLHDLSNRDLKRFLECDFFYDPKPLMGFLPQWIIVTAIFAAIGAGIGWGRSRSVLWAEAGAIGGAMFIVGVGSLGAFANRRSARAGGFDVGRRMTIAEDGVWVDYPNPPDLGPSECLDRQRRRWQAARSRPMLQSASLPEAHHPWEDFRLVEFRSDVLIFWQRGRRRLVVPVRAFESIEAAEAFARAAAGWIAERGGSRAAG